MLHLSVKCAEKDLEMHRVRAYGDVESYLLQYMLILQLEQSSCNTSHSIFNSFGGCVPF